MTAPIQYDAEGRPTFACEVRGQQLTFVCPKCQKRHWHGIGDGHRASHCLGDCWPGGYFLVAERGGPDHDRHQ